MKLEEIIEKVDVIPLSRSYWFIRTDSGQNFDVFVNNNFIGIGWNEIPTLDIINKSEGELKTAIAQIYKYDLNATKGRSKTTTIYTKLQRFNNLKNGDMVVIPSSSSSRLAFGIVKDSKIYTDINKIEDCDYVKRRKVDWVAVENLSTLDSTFYKIIKPRHAIFDIKTYANYIDNVTTSLYQKDGYTHFVLDIKRQRGVDLDLLLNLMSSIKKLANDITREFGLSEEEEQQLLIRLNVQSPGKVEFKKKVGTSIIILCIAISSCHNGAVGSTGVRKIDEFNQVHKDTLKKIDKAMEELEISRDKINKM